MTSSNPSSALSVDDGSPPSSREALGPAQGPSRIEPDALAWSERFRGGATDSELVEAAFSAFSARIFSTAKRIVGNSVEAEEIAQDVFETLLTTVRNLRDPTLIVGYLLRCTVFASLRHLRRSRRRQNVHALASWTLATDDRARDAATVLTVQEALARLAPEERVAIILRYVEGYSLDEASALMETSVSTVQRHVRRAQEKWRPLAENDVVQRMIDRAGAGTTR